MNPFFSYYGAKYQVSKHLGAPRQDLVIEPFAGSACYSTRWGVKKVKLYDISDKICLIWDFLINSSSRDIMSIPDYFECESQLEKLPKSAELLCRFWIAKGRAEPASKLSPWYMTYRNSNDCRVWGPAVKKRIVEQKKFIRLWEIDNLSYEKIPLTFAHWHVDPPYNNAPGSRYPHSDIDYKELALWCKSLPGDVDVCENSGASWLEFSDLCEVVSSRGRKSGYKSREAVWQKRSKLEHAA